MITDAAEWLRRSRADRDAWWALPPDQFRLAVWLLSVATPQDGALRFSCTIGDVARHMALTRGKLQRQLDALEQARFCDVFGQRGRGGMTLIVIRDQGKPPTAAATSIDRSQRVAIAGEPSVFGEHAGHSTRPPDGPGKPGLPDRPDDHLQVPDSNDPSDLDLQRSPKISDPDLGSDLRSCGSGDLSKYTELNLMEAAIWVRFEATEVVMSKPEQAPAVIIPDRAWAAADYLRAQVLAETRSAMLSSAPWGADVKHGQRQAWANAFRLLHGKLLRAMRTEDPDASPGAAWDEIGRSVFWVFHRQPVPPGSPGRFEIESPRSLTVKWDAIQRARRRQTQTPMRDSTGRPVDPATQHTFKRLGGS